MEAEKTWFGEAYLVLNERLNNDNFIDGAQFVFEYLEKNWPSELDESVDEEQFEVYVNDNIDIFENWIKSNKPDITINEGYVWSKQLLPQSNEPQVPSEPAQLTSEQITLMEQPFSDYYKSDFPELGNIRELLVELDELELAKNVALKAARLGEKNTDIDAAQRAIAWERLAEILLLLKENKEVSGYFEKAGDIALTLGDSYKAATYYEKAARNSVHNGWREKHRLLRKARVLYADAGVNDAASRIYISESNLKVQNSNKYSKFAGNAYRLLSNYGESPWRVLFWIIGLIILCAVLYWVFDINTPSTGLFECETQNKQPEILCSEVSQKSTNPLTYLYFSVVTFTTLGYGDYSPTIGWARLVASFQAFLGLMLSSLFIATFLRKFSR